MCTNTETIKDPSKYSFEKGKNIIKKNWYKKGKKKKRKWKWKCSKILKVARWWTSYKTLPGKGGIKSLHGGRVDKQTKLVKIQNKNKGVLSEKEM